MKILVTGASGFVGSAVVRRLIDAGHDVRCLMRTQSDRQNVEGLPIETVTGDMTDKVSLKRSTASCQAVFHVAADYRMWVPDPAHMYRVNVTGTRELMLAALSAGVERVVYTSSVATLGLNADGTPADESTPATLADMIGHYKRSKFLAEAEVRKLVHDNKLQAVIVNPSAPIGPRDIKPTPTGRLILDAISGHMPAYVDTGLNLVHVDDVAQGHLLALERGRVGERYILGAHNMSLREILAALARISGQPAPRLRLPHNLVLPVAYVSEAWARITKGGEPRVTVDGVRLAKKFMFFSIEKAKREIGYKPRPVEQALADAVNWFRDQGYCERRQAIA
ncbi:MAG: hopanoid-associated sugar epimerase [Acidiferrobacterales bacterium]